MTSTINDIEKEAKIKYLLQKMKKEGIITTNSSNKRLANWILVDK